MKGLVCDTGPLNYLIQIHEVEVLTGLYEWVLIPNSVRLELIAPMAPTAVRAWTSPLPTWCHVQNPSRKLPGSYAGLSPTDLDVLALAQETGLAVLVDDLAARKAATQLGLNLIGTIGILKLAAEKRLLPLSATLTKLRQTNIHLAESLYDDVLRRHRSED